MTTTKPSLETCVELIRASITIVEQARAIVVARKHRRGPMFSKPARANTSAPMTKPPKLYEREKTRAAFASFAARHDCTLDTVTDFGGKTRTK